jgi:hypothetical protein
MQRMIGLLALALILTGLSGCSYLFYPRAADYLTQAKGASGVETMINLTTMMETTASKAKGGKGTAIFKRLWKFKDDQPQRDLHLDLLSAELKELRDTLQTIK